MSPEPAVVARGLSKRFGRGPDAVLAIAEVGFEIGRGSTLGIIGENGSGKSTLLDLLLGSTRPSAGEVRVEQPVASLLELGSGFFHELTGYDNACQMALLSGASRPDARRLAREAVEFAELGDFAQRPVRTYSAGMLMRLGFAVASSLAAPTWIVDEVLAVGDGYFQRKCIDRLLEAKARGATLVIASHDLHAVRSLCDRVLWLERGRPRLLGATDEVVGSYEEHLRRRTSVRDLTPGTGGTGEVVIRSVRLSDERGEPRAEFMEGETLRVEVEFETCQPLESPIMGVALFRDDGTYCYGPNTAFDQCCTGRFDGRYLLTAEFPRLPLLSGSYEASVAFYDKDHVYAYAWQHRLHPFSVRSERRDHGIVYLEHRFDVHSLGVEGQG